MPVIATCGCGKRLRASNELAGKPIKCPDCGKLLVVPFASQTGGKATGSGTSQRIPIAIATGAAVVVAVLIYLTLRSGRPAQVTPEQRHETEMRTLTMVGKPTYVAVNADDPATGARYSETLRAKLIGRDLGTELLPAIKSLPDARFSSVLLYIGQPQTTGERLRKMLGTPKVSKQENVEINTVSLPLQWSEYGWLSFGESKGKIIAIRVIRDQLPAP